jgi:hypothetical protein
LSLHSTHSIMLCILLTCGKHLHDCIISLIRGDWAHKTSLVNLPTIYGSACSKPGKWAVMYLYVRATNIASFYDFDIWFWNCSDSVVFKFTKNMQANLSLNIPHFMVFLLEMANCRPIVIIHVNAPDFSRSLSNFDPLPGYRETC